MNKYSQFFFNAVAALSLSAHCSAYDFNNQQTIGAETIEVVAQLSMRPGNVMATAEGRVFATIHPMGGEFGVQLVEIKSAKAHPWPTQQRQAQPGSYSDDVFDSPLGITMDKQGGLWVVDSGIRLGRARVWGFDIASGRLLSKIDIDTAIAPPGSFAQDLAVDSKNGWAYLAATGTPAIIALNLASHEARLFSNHSSLHPEQDARLIMDGKELNFFGKPARIGINPITLSADGETLFYGPMTGTGWFSVPTQLFREGADDSSIATAIRRVGDKPVSDGAATDALGNHYFTNLMQSGIDVLDSTGKLTAVIRDKRFNWPDSVQTSEPNTLYIATNQLHKTAAASGGEDLGKAPYSIYKVNLSSPKQPEP